jgi:ankyrin repeat protein
MAELLLTHGADVHATDEQGSTPLRLALKKHHEALLEILRCHEGPK